MKLSLKEAKVTGLWASNCATYSTGLDFKFVFGPKTFLGHSRNGPLVSLNQLGSGLSGNS